MKKKPKKPENLTLPGMEARTFPKTAKQVDMSAWKDSPLYKAAIRAETERVQGVLGVKGCSKKCQGCGMTFSPDPAICPIEVFDGYKLGIDLDYDKYDILQRRRSKTESSYPAGGTEGEA